MEARHFCNPYKEHLNEQNKFVNADGNDVSDKFRDILKAGTKNLLQRLEKNEIYWNKKCDCSIYSGLSGVAYTFYHYGLLFNDEKRISKAMELINKSIKGLKSEKHVTFLTGNAGPFALAAVIYYSLGNEKESQMMISKLKSLSHIVIDEVSSIPDELMYGRAGYLFSILFVNKYITSAPIENDFIKLIIKHILNSGKNYSKAHGIESPLMYNWHDSEYLGGAHGLAGILYILLQAREFLTEDQLKNEIEPSLQWLSKLQYHSGNFPSAVGRTTDKLVHWCHGAPAMSMLFGLAYRVFNKEHYLNIALQCGDVVWERGLLKKGCGICHGVAGNSYTFLSLFQITKDQKYIYRACKFAEWCLDYDTHQKKLADRPFSLFEGLAGTTFFLVDLIKPLEAKFPGYTL